MLLKTADDKEPQIAILQRLLDHDKIPSEKKKLIQDELRNVRTGIATEKQAAFEIDFYFGPAKNHCVLHDLRLEVNGRVAQIDHLLINRFLEVYVFETKTFTSGLTINKNGEFSTSVDGREMGIASPIEQNARHITVLKDAFKEIGLPKRLGLALQPFFFPIILVSPKAVIDRPDSKKLDTSAILKLDQFKSWYDKKIDGSTIKDVTDVFKICSASTVKSLAERLAALHRPIRIDYIRRFNLEQDLLRKEVLPPSSTITNPILLKSSSIASPVDNQKFYCAACHIHIDEIVAKYCWSPRQKIRFGSKAYCRTCQKKF